MQATKETFQFGQHEVTLETGVIARQADAAVMVSMGDTTVLVTVVGKKEANESADFFPLTVNYQERVYAAGRIPGGYFKREGRPSEKETLTSRLIDRPIRPLFPNGFVNEVQVIATVMSVDPDVDPDVPALIGASAALALSGIPFSGPIGAARVGYVDGEYCLNPLKSQLENSRLDMIIAGTQNAVLMVESEADELPEEIMLGAVSYAHRQMQVVIDTINKLAETAGKPAWDWQPQADDTALVEKVKEMAAADIGEAYLIADKQERGQRLSETRQRVIEALAGAEDSEYDERKVATYIAKLEKKVVRERVLTGQPRIDGRDSHTVRPISVNVGVLPRTHGSALFTRGETQAIVVATLGTERDSQIIDALEGEYKDRFMLHYNFPPYCVGETGFMGSPKRREIGHGRLAKRGIQAVLPSEAEFPYVLRVVSEITESNGSSSMASVCGTSMALMDAGVPIKAPVAGIAMGLVKEDSGYVVLSDIMGDEDHLGDMDFKVAGSSKGVTALQMDIKIEGITEDIMRNALEQAHDGRIHILGEMAKAITESRSDVSDFAPRLITIKINPDKIRDVIGKGGAVIRGLTEQTGASIDISDDGVVTIASVDGESGAAAQRMIEDITAEVQIGEIYEGKVIKLADFGAFVGISRGNKDGLVHISQICHERVEKVSDKLTAGQQVRVKVIDIDRQGRIRFTMKDVENAFGEVPA